MNEELVGKEREAWKMKERWKTWKRHEKHENEVKGKENEDDDGMREEGWCLSSELAYIHKFNNNNQFSDYNEFLG